MNTTNILKQMEHFIDLINQSESQILSIIRMKNDLATKDIPDEVILKLNHYITITTQEQIKLIDNQLSIIELARLECTQELYLHNLFMLENNLLYKKEFFKKLKDNQTLTC